MLQTADPFTPSPQQAMKQAMKKILLTLLSLVAFTGFAQAQTTWTGATDLTWNNTGNWSGGIPNAIGATATIAPASNVAIDLTGGPWTTGTLTLGTDTTNTGNITLNNSSLTFQVASGSALLNLRGASGQADNVINSGVTLNSNLTIDGNSSGAFNKTIFAGSFNVNGQAVSISGGRKSVIFNSLTGNSSSSITLNNVSGQEAGITGNNSNYAGSFTVTSGRLTTHYSTTYTANANSLGTGLINLNTNRVGQAGLTFDGLRLQTNGATVVFSTGGIQSNQTGTNYGNLGFADDTLTLGTAANYLTGTGNLRLGGDRGFSVASTLGAFSNNVIGKVRLDQFQSTTAGSTVFRVSNGFDLASAAALELGNGGLYSTASNTTVTTGNWTVVAPGVSGITGQIGAILGADGTRTLKLTGNFADTAGAAAQPLLIGRINQSSLANNAGTGTVELSGTGSLSNPVIFIKPTGNVDPKLLLSNVAGTQTFATISGNVATANLERNGVGGTTIISGPSFTTGTVTVTAGTLIANGASVASATQAVSGASGATTLTVADSSVLKVGQSMGTTAGLPSNTFITSIVSSTSVTISNALTAAISGSSVTFNAGGALGTGAGAVTVASGGILGGSGTVLNKITVNSGGVIYPGASGAITTLTIDSSVNSGAMGTFASGAKFKFNLNASAVTSDKLSLTNGASGDFSFTNNTVDFTTIAGSLAAGQVYTLFSATAANNYTGLTYDGSNHITAGLAIGAGLESFAGSYLDLNGNNIELTVAIPEPGTWAMLLSGLGMLLGFQRSRRNRLS
jgi:hypothetical protein